MAFREPPQRPCPGCGQSVDDDSVRCHRCGYGLRAELEGPTPRAPHRTLFASEDPACEDRLSREFRCPHCRSFGAVVRKVSFMGLTDLRWIGTSAVATCRFCGALQMFDLEAFKASPGVRWDLIDVD